jgi:hypothetical protein
MRLASFMTSLGLRMGITDSLSSRITSFTTPSFFSFVLASITAADAVPGESAFLPSASTIGPGDRSDI